MRASGSGRVRCRRIFGLVSRRTALDVDQSSCVPMWVSACACACACACALLLSEPGLIAGASSHGPLQNEAKEVAILDGIRPIGGTMQGITAEVFPARAVPFALGLSRRADSDTLAAGPIGRVAVCRFEWEWEKISCNASLPAALTERLPRRSGGSGARTVGLGERGPGNWCSELSGRTRPSASASAQWHLGCTDAMTSVRPVLRSCCDSTDSTGADLMRVGKGQLDIMQIAPWDASLPGQFTAPE